MSTTVQELTGQLTGPALVSAIEENLFAAFRAFGRIPTVEVDDGPTMLRLATGLPHPLGNGVLRVRLNGDVDAQIEGTLADFASRGLPMMWWLGPTTEPADLGARLEAHGVAKAIDLEGMAADLAAVPKAPPAAPGLTVRRVADRDDLRQWGHCLTVGFELGDEVGRGLLDLYAQLRDRHYVGWWEGAPVAAASLVVGAGVAGIYNVATVPAARRRGFGSAVTWEALRDARDAGLRVAILHATPMAVGAYRRLGFRTYCTFGLHVWAGAPPPQPGGI